MGRNKKLKTTVEVSYKDKGTEKFKQGLENIEKQTDENINSTQGYNASLDNLNKTLKKLDTTIANLRQNKPPVPPVPPEVPNSFTKLTQTFKLLSTTIKGLMALQVVKWMYNFGKSVVNSASDMTELQNVTDQVFEEMADSVNKYATEAGIAMGRSTYQMKKYASDMGGVLKGLGDLDTLKIKEMSEGLANLAVDIGSFKNVTDDEAFNALRGGIVGETESLKRLGIVINDVTMKEYARNKGIKTVWENLDAATKAQLRYEAILEKTSFMQGDAARTINTYANQIKVLEANLKNISVSVGKKFTGELENWLLSFNNVMSKLNDFLNRKTSVDFALDYGSEITEVKKLMYEYKLLSEQTETTTKDRKRMKAIVEELKQKYPEELKNIDSLKSSYEDLAGAVDKVTNSIKEKIKAQSQDYYNSQLLKVQQDAMSKTEVQFKKISKSKDNLLKYYGVNLDDYIKPDDLAKGDLSAVYKALQSNRNINQLLYEQIVDELSDIEIAAKNIGRIKDQANTTAGKIVEEAKIGQKATEDLTVSMVNYGNTMAKMWADSKRRIEEQGKKSEERLAREQGKIITIIKDTSKDTTDTIIGKSIDLTKAEMLEIMKNRGVVTQFVKGELVKYQSYGSGSIQKTVTNTTNGRVSNNIITKEDFLKDFLQSGINLKKDKDDDRPKDDNNQPKEKNKYEKLLDSLNTALSDLNFKDKQNLAPKISKAAKALRIKQDEISKWLFDIAEIGEVEFIAQKIQHLQDELKIAIELKNTKAVQNIRAKIKKLEIEKIIPAIVQKLNTELDDKINNLIAQSKGLNTDDTAKLLNKVKDFKSKKQNELKAQLEKNLITLDEYNKQSIELSTSVIEYYKQLNLPAEKLKEVLEKSKIEFKGITNKLEAQLLYADVENALNSGSDADLKAKISQIYSNTSNQVLEKITEQINSTLEDNDKNIAIELLKANSDDFKAKADKIKENGSEALKHILEMILQLKEFKKAEQEAKKLKGIDLVKEATSHIGKTLKNISKGLDEYSKAFFDDIGSVLEDVNSIISNFTSAKKSILSGDILGSIGSVGSILSTVIGVVSSIFSPDKGKVKVTKETKKAQDNWIKDLNTSNDNLRISIDNLSKDVKNFNATLIKNASTNTSNKNLQIAEDIAKQIATTYANSFDATVKTRISRSKESYKWWGLSTNTDYLGTEDKEESFRKILGIPNFKNSADLEKWYNNIKNTNHNATFDDLGANSGFLGFSGYTHNQKVIGSNYKDVISMIPTFIQTVKEIEGLSGNIKGASILESFEGISVTSASEKKDQLREILKRLAQASGQDYSKVANHIEAQLQQLIQTDEMIVTAFDDVRGNIIEKLSRGQDVIDSMANSLQGYFNKLRGNFAKIMYDLQLRDKGNFEDAFLDKFKKISVELKKIRLEGRKTIKDLDPNVMDFSTIFKQLKDINNVSNDMREVVSQLRLQAKAQGLSDEIIEQMLPLDKVNKVASDISSALKTAMTVAIDTNSLEQFSMSIGDSLYKSVKESMIQAFVDSNKFQELYKKYTDTEEFNKKLAQVQTITEAYNVIKDNINKVEDKLKAEGLGFRETNTNNGEYLGGVTSQYRQQTANNGVLQHSGVNVTVNNYIDNKGFLSTTDLTNSMTEIIKDKLNTIKQREV